MTKKERNKIADRIYEFVLLAKFGSWASTEAGRCDRQLQEKLARKLISEVASKDWEPPIWETF